MKAMLILAMLLFPAAANAACNITISMTIGSPAQNYSKSWTDTDAHCNLAIQALQSRAASAGNPTPTPTQGALWWANNVIQSLVDITTAYQRDQVAAPINPQ